MSHTPEMIEFPVRKFLHNVFGFLGASFALVAIVAAVGGGAWFLAAIPSGVSFYVASKIKYKKVKRIEIGGYDWA